MKRMKGEALQQRSLLSWPLVSTLLLLVLVCRFHLCMMAFLQPLIDNAHVEITSIRDIVHPTMKDLAGNGSTSDFYIQTLFHVRSIKTAGSFIVGGGDDGSINIWDQR